MDSEAYALCRDLNGSCSCATGGKGPCAAIVSMIDEGTTADNERERIAQLDDDEW